MKNSKGNAALLLAILLCFAALASADKKPFDAAKCFADCRKTQKFKPVCGSYLDVSGKRVERVFFNKCVFNCNKKANPTQKVQMENGKQKLPPECEALWIADAQIPPQCFTCQN